MYAYALVLLSAFACADETPKKPDMLAAVLELNKQSVPLVKATLLLEDNLDIEKKDRAGTVPLRLYRAELRMKFLKPLVKDDKENREQLEKLTAAYKKEIEPYEKALRVLERALDITPEKTQSIGERALHAEVKISLFATIEKAMKNKKKDICR